MTFYHKGQQFGFEDLLADCEATNRKRDFERKTAHLLSDMDEGICYYSNPHNTRER